MPLLMTFPMRPLATPILFVFTAVGLAADLATDEKKLLDLVNESILVAGKAYAAEDYQRAGESLRDAMKQLDSATRKGSPELFDALQPAMDRVIRAHTMLEFEGIALPPLGRWDRPAAASVDPPAVNPTTSTNERTRTPTRRPQRSEPTMPAVSFSRSVAPILKARCGRCHIEDTRGGVSMASYAALMKGPPEGVVVFPGDVVASRLIEVIESGDMPRGGDNVTPAELATLRAWVQSGAKFDGENPNALIDDAAAGSAAARATPMVPRPTGSESVSFATDIAPLLVANCKGCHVDAMNARGGLQMDTFAGLLRGGDSGAVLRPGNGEQSLLVQKLRGTADGQRMPAGGRPPLPEESIRKIATWIDEGGKLDGDSENQPLTVMSQLAWASAATPEEINRRREEEARENLAVAVAGRELNSEVTENFFIVGPVDTDTIRMVAGAAQAETAMAAAVLGPADPPLFGGRATVIVLPGRYEYNEFTRMVEQRSVPADWDSHWRFDGIDAYVAVVASGSAEADEIQLRLSAPVVSLAVAIAGDVPEWLAEGVGRAVSARKSRRRDRRAQQQAEAETAAAIAALNSAEQFLDGRMVPEQAERVAAAVAASLIERSARRAFGRMIQSLKTGTPFVKAFADAYGMSPEAYIDRWRTSWPSG